MADKLTGKASYINVNGVSLYITKTSPKVTRGLSDTTDSADYDSGMDMINMSQIPVTLTQDLSVEGNYHLSQTSQALLTMCYSGISAVPVVLGLNSGSTIGSGLFDLSDFASEIPITDTVKYTCTLKSNGKFTPGGTAA